MADNFDMKRFLFENKLGSYARNTVVENRTAKELFKMFQDEDLIDDRREYDEEDLMSAYPNLSKEEAEKLFNMLQNIDENQYEGDQYDDEDEDEDEDYDLNAAFWASPASYSYDKILDIFVSYEDENILNKFKSSFPEGEDITKRDYLIFSQSTIGDMSEMDYIKANWVSLTDDDVYEKAGLIENQKEGYMGTQYGSSEDMAVDMVKKGITEKYQPGDMWSTNFDYKGMLKSAAGLSVSSPEELMQAISDSFEDVNYHRENSHLQDAIEAKKENDNDAIKFHLALFKDELKKTIKNLKETQIFEREKVEEGEAAYEYEKGKEAGEKEEEKKLKEDIGGDIGDAEAEKMMDFLAEKDKVKETLSGEAYARMDGLAPQNSLSDFRDSAYYVVATLREDGFDDEDILEFLKDNLDIAFN